MEPRLTRHSPPAVTAVASVPFELVGFALTFLVLGALQVGVFFFRQEAETLALSLLMGVWCTTATAVWFDFRNQTPHSVVWDGDSWQWSGNVHDAKCDVTVQVDLNRLILATVHTKNQSKVWLWFEAKQQPMHWLALRRALFEESRDN